MSPMTATVARAMALAERMIAKEGGWCTLTRIVQGTLNPVAQTRTADVPQSVAVKMVQKPYTPKRFETDTAVLTSSATFVMFAGTLPWEPEARMSITNALGVVFTIQRVTVRSPDGNPIVYSCDCSR